MVIKEALEEFGTALWMDSGNIAMKGRFTLHKIRKLAALPTGFYSAVSRGSLWYVPHLPLARAPSLALKHTRAPREQCRHCRLRAHCRTPRLRCRVKSL